MNEAEQIVKDLAEGDLPLDPELGDCLLCDSVRGDAWNLDDHQESCPWRRAKEWLSRVTIREAKPEKEKENAS